jgi:ribosome-associated protein
VARPPRLSEQARDGGQARPSSSRSLRFRLRKSFDETSRSVPQAGSRFRGLATAMHTDASEKMRVVEIEKEPIELYKILKFESMVQSGGEAKFVIAEGLVRVNGEVETRKSKKIIAGDIIEFEEEKIQIITK